MTLADVCLQAVMVAASPSFCSRERIRDCDGRVRSKQTLSEYGPRFTSWYLRVCHHVHNTELV